MIDGKTEKPLAGARAADLRFLIERNADGILVLDEDGLVQFANPAAEDAFGRAAAELLGADIGLPLLAGETTEIAILRPGGQTIAAEMRVVATTWAGQPARLVSLRDISVRKAEEERLRQAQKMESIGRLTAGIAHDFNNLLTVIMGNLATIQREIDRTGVRGRLPRAAEHAMEGATRAAALTQRLLAFARRQPLEPRAVDVNRLILGMSDLLHRTLGETITIETELSDGPLGALADPNQLETAILNLAVNARDAMPDGGRLLIRTCGREIESGRPETPVGAYVEIRITDTGEGMTEEVMARAFEPFFTTKEMGRGTGLGLSQVFGFVRQSGGDVQIESAPGRGASVTLLLPRFWAEEPATTADARPQGRPPSETILVVDDEEGVRAYSSGVLRELGYQVLEADSAAAALETLRVRPEIQLLFTDLGLPGGMNGRQLADEARRLKPALKVLLTSGYAGDALVRGGRLEPGLQLLSKPFTYGALAAKVRAVLDHQERPARVLIVEDEALVRVTMVEALLDAGCRIEEAATASEALAKFRAVDGELEAAIIDIGLPDGRGDGLAEAFRAARPDIAILLSTGYDDSAAKEQFARDGRTLVLEKPFDGTRLRAALRELGVAVAA